MSTTTLDQQRHTEVEDYINGKLTQEQEIAFEARYLEDPALLAEVENAQALKDGLVAALASGDFPVAGLKQPLLRRIKDYFAVPQTAMGALAATVLIVPLLLLIQNTTATKSISNSELVFLGIESFRNSQRGAKHATISLPASDQQTTLAFEVPPSFGMPENWQIRISDSDGKQVFDSGPLIPNARSTISITLANSQLQGSPFTYEVSKLDSSQRLIGIITIK